MTQFWGGGARGIFVGARLVITVEVAWTMLVVMGAVGVLSVPDGFATVFVVAASEVPVLEEEQPANNNTTSRQA